MSHRLSLPMLISCLKDRRDVLHAADPRDEHSLVGGLPGLLTQAIERLDELEGLRLLRLAVMDDEEKARQRHPTRAEIG